MAARANLVFHNNVIGGTAIKRLIRRLIDHYGVADPKDIRDPVKTYEYRLATASTNAID